MKLRATTIIALGAILTSVVVAMIVQFALLGALNLRATAGDVALQPVFNAETVKTANGSSIRLDTSRSTAAVQSKNLSINAEDALAVVLHTDETVNGQRIGIGWVTLQERRRGPANTNLTTLAHAEPHETVVVLRGHPRWAGNITQMGLGIERAIPTVSGAAASAGLAALHRLEFIPATPAGATRLMWNAWFSSGNAVITPAESANRLLPLSIWLVLVSVLSVVLTAFALRRDPARRAAALRVCGVALLVICVAATCAYSRWPGWTLPLLAGLCATLALILIERPFALPTPRLGGPEIARATINRIGALSTVQKNAASLGLALPLFFVCAWLSAHVASVLLISAAMLLVARYLSPVWATRAAMLALAPILYVAGVAQNLLPATEFLTPLADPTGSLSAVATNASGLPAMALGMVALHRAWPAAASAARWSTGAVAGAVWALAAALAILAIPKLAALAQGSSAFVALFFPFVTCVALAVWPRFRSVAASAQETVVIEQKTEADLSVQGLALLQGHADRVRNSLAEHKTATARTALRQMQQLASGAHATTSAQLRIALAEGDVAAASAIAQKFADLASPSAEDADALLDLAHRQDDHAKVIALASSASSSPFNARALSIAQLLTNGPAEALRVIYASADPLLFARDAAELYLLHDEVQSTQKALEHSGIALNEPTGQAYIARLGMRVQGTAAHEKIITSLALWNPQLGAAQAAMGELLERQGNIVGARARYQTALTHDATLWPLRYRLKLIDARAI